MRPPLAGVAAALLAAAQVMAPASLGSTQTRPSTVTSLWRDTPADAARVRIDLIPEVTEASDLLLRDGAFYTISDSYRHIYRIDFGGAQGSIRRTGDWTPVGFPAQTDLEALTALPGGEVLAASETDGTLFVLAPFPSHACAAWRSGIAGTCFFGRPNCGIEAMAVVPGGRLFVAKEREPRAAYLFDLPDKPCAATSLTGRTYLKLPDEVGPDISAATFDAASGHLLVVARSNQKVLEFEVPPATPGDTSPRPLTLLGGFSYARTENSLGYPGLLHHQVEGIAVDAGRVLYLTVDNNDRVSPRLGSSRPPLIRFFPVD
jgi:hypothetical protein